MKAPQGVQLAANVRKCEAQHQDRTSRAGSEEIPQPRETQRANKKANQTGRLAKTKGTNRTGRHNPKQAREGKERTTPAQKPPHRPSETAPETT